MNDSFENYEEKLDYIINNIKNKNKKILNKLKETENNLEETENNLEETENNLEKTENNLEENENKLEENENNLEENENKLKENENKLEKNINKIKKSEKNKTGKDADKDYYCKQLDSLNYCLEMHKVRKNKKADFDIHSIQKYNIEDKDIDKCVEVLGWKDLSKSFQKKLIDDFVKEISNKYNLEIKYTEIFINSNLNKIKYDKYEKKIVDIHGMINCIENDINILKIKQKNINSTNTRINKLRKSLSTSKKSRFSVGS